MKALSINWIVAILVAIILLLFVGRDQVRYEVLSGLFGVISILLICFVPFWLWRYFQRCIAYWNNLGRKQRSAKNSVPVGEEAVKPTDSLELEGCACCGDTSSALYSNGLCAKCDISYYS